MPAAVSKIAFFTPLYHVVNVCRASASGHIPIGDVAWLVVVVSVLAPYPFRLMRKRLIK